jgi:pyrroloquinoline quinone biosynthesis protein E
MMSYRPWALVAEITYRCPLQCPYCSNPVNLSRSDDELTTEEWCRIFDEAVQLGVMQLYLTGGEPVARKDLLDLVRHGSGLGLYTNLITGATLLTPSLLQELKEAGLDHVQVSFQDSTEASADRIAGVPGHLKKKDIARAVTQLGFPLTVNVVIHRHNIRNIDEIINLAEEVGAQKLELANTQYYAWALLNRAALLPTPEDLAAAEEVVKTARLRLGSKMEILYVLLDYYSQWPKPCMGGWGSKTICITPRGVVLPCQAAESITALRFENIRQHRLSDIWHDSASFNAFRGEDWMPEPCRSCERRHQDYGGCRCQAFMLAGDAAATDPACSLSPHHHLIEQARAEATSAPPPFIYRSQRNSRRLSVAR